MSADFALAKIAEQLGKQEAVAVLREAAATEEAGDCESAVKLYRRAYRLWAALDSALEGGPCGLPRAVRAEAEAAGINCDALAEESIETEPSQRFDLADAEQWLAHLEEHGYVVVAAVADEEAISLAKPLLWDFLESVPVTQVKRNDVSTWDDWLPSSGNGILGSLGFGQSDFCWHTRLLPGVKQAFAAIWNCDDLIVSFDGGNVFRPWVQKTEWRTEGSWWHIDQNAFLPGKEGRMSVQGLVTFTDATPATGGLCVVPGSHRQHKEVCERSCAHKLPRNFVPVQSGDPVLDLGRKLVCAKAGDLVLWDSRCVHCNTPGIMEMGSYEREGAESCENIPGVSTASLSQADAELLRVVGYVCMTPAAWAPQDVLARREQAFINNVTADHWPCELHEDTAAQPWPPAKQWSDASEAQRQMIVGASSARLVEDSGKSQHG